MLRIYGELWRVEINSMIRVVKYEYCYANGNDLISFNIKNDETKATLTHMFIELVIIKSTTTTSV